MRGIDQNRRCWVLSWDSRAVETADRICAYVLVGKPALHARVSVSFVGDEITIRPSNSCELALKLLKRGFRNVGVRVH